MSGAGILHIKPVSQTDRRFILEGDLVAAPRVKEGVTVICGAP
jgi:hypothetical protein